MKDLVPIENEKNDALSRLTRFYKKADIVLTAEEETILTRWTHVDALLRQAKLKTPQIIDDLVTRFGVSKYTAQTDIAQAQILFGRIRYPDKKFQLTQHLEDLNLKIKQASDDKSLMPFLPKLYQERLKAIIALEDMPPDNDVPAPVIYIGVVEGQEQQVTGQFSFEQAKQLLLLEKMKQNAEDADYEDVK